MPIDFMRQISYIKHETRLTYLTVPQFSKGRKMQGTLKSAVFFIILFSISTNSQPDKSEIKFFSGATGTGRQISIKAQTGQFWFETFAIGPFKIKITPQIAIWAEDSASNFLQTIYVTKKFGKQEWNIRIKFDPGTVFRADALPVWYHRSGYLLSKNNPLPDAFSGASPKSHFLVTTNLSEQIGKIRICMEINNSYDYSSIDRKNAEGDNGQPSVVYATKVDLAVAGVYPMKIIGRSDPKGLSGEIDADLSKITTASKILSECEVIITEQP
jgi:hypothetical protein